MFCALNKYLHHLLRADELVMHKVVVASSKKNAVSRPAAATTPKKPPQNVRWGGAAAGGAAAPAIDEPEKRFVYPKFTKTNMPTDLAQDTKRRGDYLQYVRVG